MRRIVLGGLVVASLMLAGQAATEEGVAPASLQDAFRQASPANREATRELWQSKYAGLPDDLRQHLEQKYPGLDLRLTRALGKFSRQHPGLALSLSRHLLEDLGEEPATAALDVAEAVVARYPEITRRNSEREPALPDGFVDKLLGKLQPGFSLAIRKTVVDTVQAGHPGLPEQVLHTVLGTLSRGERRQLWMSFRGGQRPLVALWHENPQLVLKIARQVQQQNGSELRSATIEVLAALEKDQSARLGEATRTVLGLVGSDYPELPARLRQARRERRAALREQYPDLMKVVASTMQERHPQLLARALQSVESHYPGLRDELWQSLESEMPGVRAEVRGYLGERYPDLFSDLEASLRGVEPGPSNR